MDAEEDKMKDAFVDAQDSIMKVGVIVAVIFAAAFATALYFTWKSDLHIGWKVGITVPVSYGLMQAAFSAIGLQIFSSFSRKVLS